MDENLEPLMSENPGWIKIIASFYGRRSRAFTFAHDDLLLNASREDVITAYAKLLQLIWQSIPDLLPSEREKGEKVPIGEIVRRVWQELYPGLPVCITCGWNDFEDGKCTRCGADESLATLRPICPDCNSSEVENGICLPCLDEFGPAGDTG